MCRFYFWSPFATMALGMLMHGHIIKWPVVGATDYSFVHYNLNMAEGRPNTMEFQIKKELFEMIARDLTCDFCKIVPRKGPIYCSFKGSGSLICL